MRVAVTAASLLKHSKKGELGREAVVRNFRTTADVECWKASLCVWKSQNGNSKADGRGAWRVLVGLEYRSRKIKAENFLCF